MLSFNLLSAAGLLLAGVVRAAHGDGAEGTVMGPVAFLWPDDRSWDAAHDNIAPCGSASTVGNRTEFPLSQGSVALTVADEAYYVALFVAFDNDPTLQSQFQEQIVNNITQLVPGHQCYKIDDIPDTVTAGTNATIQLQYWSDYEDENSGKNESFYACADITFVEVEDFTAQVACFNVTASTFDSTDTSSSSAVVSSTAMATAKAASSSPTASTTTAAVGAASSSAATTTSTKSSGLSAGAKAGIAVGAIIGGLGIGALAAFIYFRSRRASYLETRRARLSDPIQLVKRNVNNTSVGSQT